MIHILYKFFILIISIFNIESLLTGIPIDIDNQSYLLPYGTRKQYLTICKEKNIHPSDKCADSLEEKNIERLKEMESIYAKYQLLQKENIGLRQQNIILKEKLLSKIKTSINNRKNTNVNDDEDDNDNIIENNNKDKIDFSIDTVSNVLINKYNDDLIDVNIDSVRNHRCKEQLKQLPKVALEKGLTTNFNTGHAIRSKNNDLLLKQVSSRGELIHLLNDLGLNGEAAELGVYRGKYSEEILSIWKPPGRLHLIDIWEEIDNYNYIRNSDMNKTINRLKKFGADRYNLVKKYTTEAALIYPDNYFDFIYLDASHTYESARRDIQMWWPKLKQGGIFAGDDYIIGNYEPAGYRFGVKDAVDEFASIYNLRVNEIWKHRGEIGRCPLPQFYIYKC